MLSILFLFIQLIESCACVLSLLAFTGLLPRNSWAFVQELDDDLQIKKKFLILNFDNQGRQICSYQSGFFSNLSLQGS